MNEKKLEFIRLLLAKQVLKFGNFTLKSGRQSPYFFNLGAFNTGASLATLGHYYARTIVEADINYNMLFGPAYKGIPLVSATSIALATEFNRDMPYCFNRKLKKNYGDGGDLVGAPLEGKVIMIDDVVTAGTTIRDTLEMISQYRATLAAIVIAFDRQEKGQGQQSALKEAKDTFGIPIYSIINLQDIIDYLQQENGFEHHLARIEAYQEEFGVQ